MILKRRKKKQFLIMWMIIACRADRQKLLVKRGEAGPL